MARPAAPRAWTVAIWLACLAAGIAVIVRAPFSADMSVFLPRDPGPEQRLLVANLTGGPLSRTLLIGVDDVAAGQQGAFARAFALLLRADAQFELVLDGDPTALAADQALLLEHRYVLSPAVDAKRFEVDGLRAAISESIAGLASATGFFTKQLLPRDPTGETLLLANRMEAQGAPRQHDGAWVSPDGRRVILLAYARASGTDLDGQAAAIAAVRAAFALAKDRAGAGAARLVISGAPVFAVESRETIRGDVARLSLFGIAGIVALIGFFLRSARALLLCLVPMGSAVVAGAAAAALVFGSLHGLTLGFGTTLVGEAVDYAIYRLVRGEDGDAGFWPTIRLGVLTSIAGFAALLFSGFPGLAQLAAFSISGLVAAALVARYVLPVLTPPDLRATVAERLVPALAAVVRRLRGARAVTLVLSAAAIALAWGLRDGLWDRDIAALNPVSAAARAVDADLRGSMGVPDARLVLTVSAPDDEGTLVLAEEVGIRLDRLIREGVLEGYETPVRNLPSQRTQALRRAALPAPEVLAARLEQALAGLPLSPSRLALFVADVARAREQPPLLRPALSGTALGIQVESLLTHTPGGTSAILPLRGPSGANLDPARLSGALAGLDPAQVRLFDVKRETDSLYSGYLGEAIVLSTAGAVAIVALLALALRRVQDVLAVVVPLVAAVALLVGGFALAGKALNLLHLVGLLLVVAVGSNYALFFRQLDPAVTPEAPATRMLPALLLANLTTVCGFGVLAFSKVPLLSALGLTVGLGSALALVLSAVWAAPEARRG